MTIGEAKRRYQKANVPNAIQSTLEETKDEWTELNRHQMLAGQGSDGVALPEYSPVSVQQFGKPPGPWRLYDTGSFQKKMQTRFTRKDIAVFSTDEKSEYLQMLVFAKVKTDIFGLQAKNKAKFAISTFKPVFFKKLFNEL